MNTKDPVIAKTELVIDALRYALANKLDINNEEDVKKILIALDPEHSSDEEVEEFTILLQSADTFMEMKATEKAPQKTDLPN